MSGLVCQWCRRRGTQGFDANSHLARCANRKACRGRAVELAAKDPTSLIAGRLVQSASVEQHDGHDVLYVRLSHGLIVEACTSYYAPEEAELSWQVHVTDDFDRPWPIGSVLCDHQCPQPLFKADRCKLAHGHDGRHRSGPLSWPAA